MPTKITLQREITLTRTERLEIDTDELSYHDLRTILRAQFLAEYQPNYSDVAESQTEVEELMFGGPYDDRIEYTTTDVANTGEVTITVTTTPEEN